MRTKTLLSIAAVFSAGLAASVAQTVYSVNAVGYVNVVIQPGYNLISNPLNATNNQINTVMPAAAIPDGFECLTWDILTQDFAPTLITDSGSWFDQLGNPTFRLLNPGRAFFIHSSVNTNITLTFVGDVPQGGLTNSVAASYDFVSSIVPQSAPLTLSLGFTPPLGLTIQTFDPLIGVAGDYAPPFEYVGVDPSYPSGWADALGNPANPAPNVAQGFLTTNPGGAFQWGRTFSVN